MGDGWLVGDAVWTIPIAAFLVVSALACGVERILSRSQGADRASSITSLLITRAQAPGPATLPEHLGIARAPARVGTSLPEDATEEQRAAAFAMAVKEETKHWEDRLVELRTGYLQRTRESARSWRDVFAALSAVGAGAVGVAAGSAGFGAFTGNEADLYWVVSLALAASLNASFYTGWAAAGTPRSWSAQSTADQLRVAELQHAARSQQRLRLGMAAGAFAVVGAALIALVALGSALGV